MLAFEELERGRNRLLHVTGQRASIAEKKKAGVLGVAFRRKAMVGWSDG
jgi:hypothetical protein